MIGASIPNCSGDSRKDGSQAFAEITTTRKIRASPTIPIDSRARVSPLFSLGIQPNFPRFDCSTITIFWRKPSFSPIAKPIRSFSNLNSSWARTARTNSRTPTHMKKIFLIISALFSCAFDSRATLNVVATLPDFGALAREIGGDNVSVTVLAKPTEDPHFVDARPSFVVQLRNRSEERRVGKESRS